MTEQAVVEGFMKRVGISSYELIVDESGTGIQAQLYLLDSDTWITGEGETLEDALIDLEGDLI